MKQKIVRISALVGVLIFGFIIYKIGPAEIWQNIKKLSVCNFLILVGLRILYWLLGKWSLTRTKARPPCLTCILLGCAVIPLVN